MWIEERQSGQRFFRNEVVIDDGNVDACLGQLAQTLVIRRPTITSHDQVGLLRDDLGEGGSGNPVSAVESTGEERKHLPSELLDHVAEDDRRCHPIAVIVSEDDDSLTLADGLG
jgi:hypothetical protein